ncbi:PHP domain-containing protein [Aurantibacillus circumpalustris]|uniref:PHP domain-containing protein n=1 Tax=Aurantibacillus circumpalustris TaxID=3036359 RepID=UPI00295BDCE3|nr:PHP domain-containing protein [Aurantibacillus circumpalustris]
MSNDDITDALEITAKLMELHNENPFKTRAYTNAAFKLSKMRFDFQGKTPEEIAAIEGIGKGISSKIVELISTGTTEELSKLRENTPDGVIEILGVKGLGPKKVRQLWKELEVESIGELLYACNENRLITLKGFGEKTQTQVKQNIEFKLANKNKFHYASIEKPVNTIIELILEQQNDLQIAAVGQLARKCEIIDKIEILIDGEITSNLSELEKAIPLKITYTNCEPGEFFYKYVELTSTPEHLERINFSSLDSTEFFDDEEVYTALNLQYIEPELREGLNEVKLAEQQAIPKLIEVEDLKGILHNHSTYSDGVHTLKEMADYCKGLGYHYFGICDHSKTAVYAGGLPIEKVIEQQKEIDKLNAGYTDFKILKGIESDILNDGSLDYPEEILKTFDFVVASVHSNLKMTEEKATERLIEAIENPYTSILGHPTGRLLLARKGYPINHKKVIDACAVNKVSIELNAHPYRLDIDWRWIPYCLEKGVMISINPDAHHKEGLKDMYYGVCAARKGMLSAEHCLNALSLEELLLKFKK